VSTSYHCHCSRSSATSKVTLNVQILALEVLQVTDKTVPMAFFLVDMKGRYNVLLRRDWIHTNGCLLSTLHQCVIQWIVEELEVVQANEEVCIVMAKSRVDILGGKMEGLFDKDLMGYYYISVGKDGFFPISVKSVIGATRLAHDL
jgi:hypothetical protein